MNATPVKGGGELRPAGTAEGQAHTSLSGNNLYQFDLFSFICFNFKPKFSCSSLSRCSAAPASLSWPGVPLVSQRWTFRGKVLTVVSVGVGAGYSHSNTSHKNDDLPCASACRRIIIFTDQMERQAHFRLLTLYYRHFPSGLIYFSQNLSKWKVFCGDCITEQLEQILPPSYSLTQKILVAIFKPSCIKRWCWILQTPPPMACF